MDPTNGYQLLSGGDVQYAGSQSPHSQAPKDPAIHQRTYQACIPCRRRKVRCDLGSVDNPHDPPCVRCRRESKECFFSSTRRKKKNADADDSGADVNDEVYEIKSGRKRLRITPEDASIPPEGYDEPRTPGGSIGRTQPLRRPQPQKPVEYGEEDHKASDQTAAMLQASEVHSGHDALKVLYEAAQLRDRLNSKGSLDRPNFSGVSPSSLPPATSPVMEKNGMNTFSHQPMAPYAYNDPTWKGKVESQGGRGSFGETPIDPIAHAAAVKAWSRHRFVRAGWFTAKEAIDYIQYFYKYLAPLTPVALPDFRSPETHEKLLTQEPMLTITMLLIASRHMRLDGPGALSRPYSIHDRVWEYLSGMIDRVIWGQEQFGGGFCGAGAEPGSDVNPLTRKGLRTLGTVESLVLLTEWHPRAMHFPPKEADEELMLPTELPSTPELADDSDPATFFVGGQRMDAWLEPCWRSDRMCWMLLGISMSLAFEIGVFDSSDWQRHARSIDGLPLSAEDLQTYDDRRGKVRDVLLIYVSQTSGRLGLTSMLPNNYSKPEDSDLFKRNLGQHSSIQETTLHFWLRMAALMREGNSKVFANKAFTRDLIKNGDYRAALDDLQRPLEAWRKEFDTCLSIPKYMRYILEIEFDYCRVYLNALALQAVAERCANEHPLQGRDLLPQILDPPADTLRALNQNGPRAISTNGMRTDVPISPQTLAKWLGVDRKYMLAVGDAARHLLKVVVDGLYPGEYLRHAPVRTYFRIISVAIMLLKSFSLGASESDVADSLTLMDRTVQALKTCVVDDVHVASRFAELLEILTNSLKPRLIRITADGRTSRSRRISQHGTPAPLPPLYNEPSQRYQGVPQYQASAGAMPAQPQWNYNLPNTSTNTSTPSNPLYGISNDTYDLTNNEHFVMPPPNFNLQSPNSGTLTTSGVNGNFDSYATSGLFADGQDWLTLPLDNLINVPGAEVNQTMYGPQLGEHDMLELLLGTQQNGQNGYG